MSEQAQDVTENDSKPQKTRQDVAGAVWELQNESDNQLSPISAIALILGEASIATPTTTKQKTPRAGEFRSSH